MYEKTKDRTTTIRTDKSRGRGVLQQSKDYPKIT